MTEVKFSYKEAIAHGWAMAKKYSVTLLASFLVIIVFQGIGGVLGYFAGSDRMPSYETRRVYTDPAQASRLYEDLKTNDYIGRFGQVHDKLRNISAPSQLTLSPEFDNKRDVIYSFLEPYRYRLPFPKPVYYGLSFLLWAVSVILSIGFLKITLMMSRDEEPSLTELFSNAYLFVPYVLAGLCYGVVVFGGFLLLIIPGCIFLVMFQLYNYLVIDKELGPIESLKRSRVITKGSRWRMAIFASLLLLLNLAGALCLLIGLFVTIPISFIASAYVYDRLENAEIASA